MVIIPLSFPRARCYAELGFRWYPLVDALSSENREFNLRHIEPACVDRGVVKANPFHELFGNLVAERLAERGCVVGIQIVEDHMDGRRLAVPRKVNNALDLLCEVLFCATVSDDDLAVSAFRFNGDEKIRCPVPCVLVVAPSYTQCRHRLDGTRVCVQFLALFIKTEDGFLRIVRLCVQIEHIFHASNERFIHSWNAPHFFPATASNRVDRDGAKSRRLLQMFFDPL